MKVGVADIHQGGTTESTSLVTHVSFNGTAIPLGDADDTPFTQADIDSAVSAYSATHHTADGTDHRPSPMISPAAAGTRNVSADAGLRRSHSHLTAEPVHMVTAYDGPR